MSYALIRKTARDSLVVLCLAVTAIFIFEVLFIHAMAFVLKEMPGYFNNLHPMFRKMVSILAGADILGNVNPTGLMSVGLTHPFLHLVLWAYTVTYTSRVIVGEIDNGSIDILLSLPMRRSSMYLSLTVVWLVSGVLLSAAPIASLWICQNWMNKGPFDLPTLSLACVNLYALYVAIGAGGFLLSASMSRRAHTVGVMGVLLLSSFALSFLALVWDALQKFAFLSFLEYYQPLRTIQTQALATPDITRLLAAAAVTWTLGLIIFCRRDIRTG